MFVSPIPVSMMSYADQAAWNMVSKAHQNGVTEENKEGVRLAVLVMCEVFKRDEVKALPRTEKPAFLGLAFVSQRKGKIHALRVR